MPQRRDRIYLVADLTGQRAGEILFEQESLRGDPAQGAAQGKRTPANAAGSVGGSAGFLHGQGVKAHGIGYSEEQTPTLRSQAGGNSVPCVLCQTPQDAQGKRTFGSDGLFPTLAAGEHGGQNSQLVPYTHFPICFAQNQRDEVRNLGERSGALSANAGMKQQSYLAYALQGNGIDRADTAGCNGCGWKPNIGYTLNTIDRHAVCYQKTVGALCAADWRGPNSQYAASDKLVVNLLCTDARGNGNGKICSTVTGDHESRVTDYTNIIAYGGEHAETLDASYYKGAGARNGREREFLAERHSERKYIVRRLTPTECARLQGLPDCWATPIFKDAMSDEEAVFWERVRRTHAEINGKRYRPFARRDQLVRWYNRLRTDSSEYKLYGNGIALPCAEFVLHGVAEVLKEAKNVC